ncbi:sigma-54 interaction domain-containing protein [Anaerofustis stercorihominis]|uniref:sigma-54 interaction domain-containing protein n=1 Tax=Anaerofustis stercorihominis TaxID=214853 RepID=UPI00214AA805|nr:sigma 54-interacting transcriptional regulator [Anaerofustis stercorihominis]MCR2033449.1 sigma 54-interacting transcriptional regulator [Anaerofustis stercorihominis]
MGKNDTNNFSIFNNLQEANDRLDAIIENSFDGIYITDGNANTIKANKSYEMITGLKKEEVIGKNMLDLVKNNVISVSGSLLAMQKKKPITLQQEFKTGKKALITSSPVIDDNGDIIMVVTNVRDLTEIYNLKEEIGRKQIIDTNREHKLSPINNNPTIVDDIICVDKKSIEALNIADKVAGLDATVMLLGDTGVGKELFANHIYKNSNRKDKPFIKINCGAISPNLVESELFGYEKGAFTGANKNGKAGLFEVADKGTIFLDEIGELPLNMQVKLLRVLQEQEIERIGGTKPIKIDVRIIAATNADMEDMVDKKLFRKDLYYRLMVFPIYIPSLRERKEDIIPLTNLFINNFNDKYGFNKKFSESALEKLKNYDWPGNIRELRNIVERGLIICSKEKVNAKDLPLNISPKSNPFENIELNETKDLKKLVESIELKYINEAYKKYKNVRDAAASLNMDPSTFVRKRKRYAQK